MPTIDIPDKICIKCSSTRWRVNPNTGYKRCTNCSNANSRKNYKKESCRIKYYKNIEKYREIAKRGTKKYRDANKEKLYSITSKYLKDKASQLGDLYIKSLLTKRSKLTFREIPQDLIELKRKQLLLTRQIRNNGKK
jgi:putative salt-induced outer membrane protein YdiY